MGHAVKAGLDKSYDHNLLFVLLVSIIYWGLDFLMQAYVLAATVDVRRVVTSLAINQNDTQVAVVETESGADDLTEDAVVRLYEIGMTRQEDDELVSLSIILAKEGDF